MDLNKAIRELYAEKQRLEEAIASLEELLESKTSAELLNLDEFHLKKRRGRKSMPPEERRVVSERMKGYWARQRAGSARGAGKGQS